MHFETVSSHASVPSSDLPTRKGRARASFRFRCLVVLLLVCIAVSTILAFLRAQWKTALVLLIRPVPPFLLAFAFVAGRKVDSPRLTSNNVLACSSKFLVIMLVRLCVVLRRGPLSSFVSASFASFACRVPSPIRSLRTSVSDLFFLAFVAESHVRMRLSFHLVSLQVTLDDGRRLLLPFAVHLSSCKPPRNSLPIPRGDGWELSLPFLSARGRTERRCDASTCDESARWTSSRSTRTWSTTPKERAFVPPGGEVRGTRGSGSPRDGDLPEEGGYAYDTVRERTGRPACGRVRTGTGDGSTGWIRIRRSTGGG